MITKWAFGVRHAYAQALMHQIQPTYYILPRVQLSPAVARRLRSLIFIDYMYIYSRNVKNKNKGLNST
jgi:hypothetical protein